MTTYHIPIRTGEYADAEFLIVTFLPKGNRPYVHGAAKTEKGAWQKRKTLAGAYWKTTGLRVLRRVADGEYVELEEQE